VSWFIGGGEGIGISARFLKNWAWAGEMTNIPRMRSRGSGRRKESGDGLIVRTLYMIIRNTININYLQGFP
jgi:hypothetical protein